MLGGTAYVAPSDKINIAVVGAAGKGRLDIQSVAHKISMRFLILTIIFWPTR